MKLEQQIPRNALIWIVLAQFSLLLPHLGRVPVWLVLVYVAAAGTRVLVYQGRWSFPGRSVKLVCAATCLAGIWLSYDSLIGLEPTVALLLAAFALKLLELAQKKDAYLLLFLAYFVCVTEFLFNQELHVTLYLLAVVTVITAALVALQQPEKLEFSLLPLRRAGIMLLQAFPLMLILFLVFPRIDPLWSVPLQRQAAKSGVSDFMSPGDISNLSLSDEVAFRVQFDDFVPARSQLYWRGLVFSRLDDSTWRALNWTEVPANERRPSVVQNLVGQRFDYSVLLEATQQNWLYSLRYARPSDLGIMSTNDFRLQSPVVLEEQKQYRVSSWTDIPIELELSEWRREVETQLPLFGNSRTRELAQRMYAEAGGDSRSFVRATMDMFREQDFHYTLRPPRLGGNGMDEFLFDTRRGFCEHYAAVFVYMMRAAGVPARVIAGYQGGELSPVNGTLIVHQFDAHAWAEVWLPGEGWVRADPTAAIAPERIERGLEFSLGGEEGFLSGSPLSPLRYRNVAWLNLLRLRLDALNYSWQRMVMEFDSAKQYNLLSGLIGEISPARIATLVGAIWLLVLGPVLYTLLRRQAVEKLDPATQSYLEFCVRLADQGCAREPRETPADFARRATLQRPEWGAQVAAITSVYEDISYLPPQANPELQLQQLRKLVRAFRPRKK
jgi:transglutaminase-like putative cysteine protease